MPEDYLYTEVIYFILNKVFALSNTEIVGSNPTGGMDVSVCSVCVYSVST
jgi:hypothetical protein